MKRELLILIFILFAASRSVLGGEVLNSHTGVVFREVYKDSVNGATHIILPVIVRDWLNRQEIDSFTVDLTQAGFWGGSQLEIFITDWARDRVLFAETRQVIIPDYYVLNLRTRSIYRPQSDILGQVYGDIYMSPQCNYIVYFGRNDSLERETGQYYLQNPSIIFTDVINAENFNLVARIDSFSATMGTYPPHFFFSGDTTIYIVNPFTGPGNRQLVKLALPSLAIEDTIKFALVCDTLCPNTVVWDQKASFALLYSYSSNDTLQQPAYLVVDLLSKSIVSRLSVPISPIYGAARLSDDANFVAFQERQRYLIYDRLFRRHFTINGAGDFTLPGAIFGEGTISLYSQRENAIVDYDLETGRFLRRR
jgi:hypothetical protein